MALVGNISGSGGVSNTIGITGSLIIANPGTAAFPTFPGSDVALFVSGNIASKPATSPNLSVRGTTVFGGDVVISGTLFGGSPLHIGTFLSASQGAEIGGVVTFTSTTAPTFNNGLSGSLTKLADGTSYLVAGSNVTISTGSNGAITISSAGGGGGGSNFFLDDAGAGKIYTTASSVAFPFGEAGIDEAADKGSNVHFYVSGSSDGLKTALFGGDVFSSGSLTLVGNLKANANTPRTIFSDVTDITVGGASSVVNIAGDLQVSGNDIKMSGGATAITFSGAGDVAVAGDLTVTGNDIKSSTATALTLAGANVTAAGNLTVSGDLTVNGTTTTVNTNYLLVEDPTIYLANGSVSSNQDGGIAIASGSSVTDQALVWGRVAQDTWGAGRLDVRTGSVTDLTTMSLLPVRASKFEVGSANAFITSSNGNILTLNANPSSPIQFRYGAGGVFAEIVEAGTDIRFGATGGKKLTVSGSQLFINSAKGVVSAGTTFQADGVNILAIQSGSINGQLIIGPGPGMTRTDIINTDSTTVNFAGAATSLTMGATAATTVTLRGGTILGNTSVQNLFDSTATTVNFAGAGIDINIGANGSGNLYLKNATTNVSGTLVIAGNTSVGNADTDTVTFTAQAASHLIPNTNNAYDLGSPSLRWRNMYTGDLHLRNDRGDWTIIEEREFLSITNNHTGRRYKFVMQEI